MRQLSAQFFSCFPSHPLHFPGRVSFLALRDELDTTSNRRRSGYEYSTLVTCNQVLRSEVFLTFTSKHVWRYGIPEIGKLEAVSGRGQGLLKGCQKMLKSRF